MISVLFTRMFPNAARMESSSLMFPFISDQAVNGREGTDFVGNVEMQKAAPLPTRKRRHWRQCGRNGAVIAVSSTQKHS